MFKRAPSPVVVKEMRQGLKSRGFILGLTGLQLLMVFSMLMYLSGESRSEFEDAHTLFWLCIALPLLVIIPLRGFHSMDKELQGKTLELVLLTRLTARQIVKGKWQAMFNQSVLTFVSALPYLLMRYYLGSVEVVDDVIVLVSLLILSGQFTAFGVYIGSIPTRRGRCTRLVVGLFLFMFVLNIISIGSLGVISWPEHFFIMPLSLVITAAHLDSATNMIARPKHSYTPIGLPYGDTLRV